MQSIKIKNILKQGNKLIFHLDISNGIRKYFNQNFLFFEYNKDISDVPESVLVIPAVANLITISWALGCDLYVNEVDEDYVDGLMKIKEVFQVWFPQFSFKGKFFCNVVKNKSRKKGYGLLLGGGIDSFYTYFKYKNKKPILFSVFGASIPSYMAGFCKKVKTNGLNFAKKENLDIFFINTNSQDFIKQSLLTKKFKIRGWWSNVSHGLVLISSTAPISFQYLDHLLIGSSHVLSSVHPWGSHPGIDNNIKFSGINVVHCGFNKTRQEKMEDFLKENQGYGNFMRFCYHDYHSLNCSNCEKCYRTILGLFFIGINPNKFNLIFNNEKLNKIKRRFQNREFFLSPAARGAYFDLQKRLIKNPQIKFYDETFFNWFKNYDFKKYNSNKFRMKLNEIMGIFRIYVLKKNIHKLKLKLEGLKWKLIM